MPSIPVNLGDPLPLSLTLLDGDTGMFPQAHVYDSAGSSVAGSPFDLTHVALGRYTNTAFTPTAEDIYTALFITYTNAGHTSESAVHGRVEESYDVKAIEEFVRDDALTFDANNKLLTARRRIFPTAALANASTPGGTGEGEISTFDVTATHTDATKWESLLRVKQ